LFVLDAGVDGDQGIESSFGGFGEQDSIGKPTPSHERYGEHFVADNERAKAMRQVFVEK
jgi:hypothetical protein